MNETIHFTCPECNHQIQLPSATIGKQGKCPACDQVVSIQPAPNDDDSFLAMALGADALSSAEDILPLDDPMLANNSDKIPIESLGNPELEAMEYSRLMDSGRLRNLVELQEEANKYLCAIMFTTRTLTVCVVITCVLWVFWALKLFK